MTAKQVIMQSDRVTIEGDELYYEVRGQGQPLLMIPAASGDGEYYAAIAHILSDEYKVIIYNRRANSRSTMDDPQNFEISQQNRDAMEVLHAVGEQSAFFLATAAAKSLRLIWRRPSLRRSDRWWSRGITGAGASQGSEMPAFLCRRLPHSFLIWFLLGRTPVHAWHSNSRQKANQGSKRGYPHFRKL